MNINSNYTNKNNKTFFKSNNETKIKEYQYSGEYDSISKSLKLASDKIGWFDAQRTYIVNKDGSGTLITNWGSKKYPKESFSEVLDLAKKMLNKNSRMFSDEEIETLIKLFEEKKSILDN